MRRKAGISIWQSLHLDLSFSGVTDSSPRNGKPSFHKETDDSYCVIIALVYLFIVVFRTDPALGTEAVLSSPVLIRVRKYNSLYLSPPPAPHPPAWKKSASARRMFMKFVVWGFFSKICREISSFLKILHE
jgi:hypothetical protein